MDAVVLPLLYISFIFLRFINDTLRGWWWKITGCERQFTASLIAPVTEKKVQVLRILLKQTEGKSLSPTSSDKYLCWHEDFYPMDYLLRPNVSLCVVKNGSETYFLETDPSANIFDIRANPFFFMSQSQHAIKLIRVHSSDLIEYCKTLTRPGVQVTWVLHSTRCGSTALAQALASLPNWRVLSENGWLTTIIPRNLKSFEEISAFFKGTFFRDLAKACLKIQLLHFSDDSNLCWKTTGSCESWVLPVLAEEYPEHKIIYMLRDGQKTANSMFKTGSASPVFSFFQWIFNQYPDLILQIELVKRFQAIFCNGYLTEATLKYWLDGNLTMFESFYCHWLTNMRTLQENGRDIPMMIIEYDFYLKNLPANLEKVLEYIGVASPDNLKLALDSYTLDSQQNSPLARERLKGLKSWVRHESTVKKATELAKSFDLPTFDEPLTQRTFNSEKWTFIMGES